MKRNLTPSAARPNRFPSAAAEGTASSPLEHFEKLLTEDLHDSVCQTLAGTSLLVNLLCRQAETGRPVQGTDLQKVAGFLERAMDDLRALMSSESLSAVGLAAALEKFAVEMSQNSRRRLLVEAEDGIDEPRTTLVLYRLARWAVRHAMKSGDEATVRATRHQGAVTLEVSGTGAAFSQVPEDELDFLHQYARIADLAVSIDPPGHVLRLRSQPSGA
jgi:signal transduction histidine kinase